MTQTVGNAQLQKHLDERARLQSAECSGYESGEPSGVRVVVNAVKWAAFAIIVLAVVIMILRAWLGQ